MRYMRGGAVTKRLIEIDDALLDAARGALGTTGITETVVTALARSVDETQYRERLDRISRLGATAAEATQDLLNDDVMRGAWR